MLYTFPHTKRDRRALPLTIDMMGYQHLQEPVMRSDSFPLFQWIYCVDGKGEFIIHGQKSVLYPDQMVLIYPREPHSYHALTPQWHVHIIGFSGSCCREVLRSLNMHRSGIYHFENSEIFRVYFDRIVKIQEEMKKHPRQKKRPFLTELSKLCYDFLLDLSGAVRFIGASVPDPGNEIVKTLIAYMEEHYQEPISLETLAEQVNRSRSHISAVFKQEMQLTIMQYLTNLRVGQARVMLVEFPEMRVWEIGRACGFESPSYFGETFKKVMGVSPEIYRGRT